VTKNRIMLSIGLMVPLIYKETALTMIPLKMGKVV
jgi:hypothetical protein